nr:hypothetical protein [Allomuricauda sp.]
MSERKELFYNLLNNFFSKEGFRLVKSKNAFIKKDNKGNEYVFRYTAWPMFIQVETKLDIQIKEVDEVKKKAWGKNYFKAVSVGTSKAYLVDNHEGTLWTETEKDVRIAVQKEIEFYAKIGKKYFEDYSSIAFLDNYLNSVPKKNLDIAYNVKYAIVLALIVAKLNDNPNLVELCDIYREISVKYDFHKYYDPLVEYITSNKVL